MKLYYSPGACSLADHIALVESGLPFELEKVDLKTKRTEGGEDYNAINPKGYVPALKLDDGAILTENIAVLGHISEMAGKLMPTAGIGRWRVIETAAFVSTELHKNFKAFFTPGAADAEMAVARDLLTKRFALMEQQIGDREFIVGNEMTIADCYLFVTLFWATTKVKLDLPPRLADHYERVKARPSVVRAMADEGLG